MKKLILCLIICCCYLTMSAQGKSLKELVSPESKAYIEFIDVKKNIPEAKEAINKALQGEEWNHWTLTESKEDATFILKVSVEKKGMNPLSFASDGARVRVIAEILDMENKTLWKSKRYQGNASVFTGFSALDDAMRKLVRRALGEELMKKCEEQL